MGYSRSVKTVENRKGWLGELLDGRPQSWETKIGEEQMIAYQIRECFYVAECNPGVYPGLDSARRAFVVEVSPGIVTARERIVRTPTTLRLGSAEATVSAVAEPTKHLAGEVSKIGPKTVNSIVQDWITMGSKGILHCPQAGLGAEELRKLSRWADGANVLVFWADPMITIREYDPELAPLSFDPAEDLSNA